MPKGMYTQGICILLDQPADYKEMIKLLEKSYVVRERDRDELDIDYWAVSGAAVRVDYLPEDNGYVVIDTVDRPWPDDMGDVETEPMVFSAWSMGNFGPQAYPGGLERAAQQNWAWEKAETVPEKHKAFIRIRTSYAFGLPEDSPVIPENYQARPELDFITKIAYKLLDLKGTICYFNPNGEILCDKQGLEDGFAFYEENDLPPFDIWANVRFFKVDENWSLMDSVGNGQLDIPDVEAGFSGETYDPNEISNFLRNISLYIMNNGEVIKDGDTMDGPGDIRWQAHECKESITAPPRRTLRWFPMDDSEIPEALQNQEEDEEEEGAE